MNTVLIVEDDAHIRRVLRTLLEHEGFAVREACDGLEGLNSVLAAVPACIVTDTMMPKMDGLKMLEGIVKQGISVPSIVVSAAVGLPGMDELKALGVVEVFGKPFSFDRLIALVAQVAGGKRRAGK